MPKRRNGQRFASLSDLRRNLPDHLIEQNKRIFDRAPDEAPGRRAGRKSGASKPTPGVTEHDLQVALIEQCNALVPQYPELARLFAIPNGAKLPYTFNANGERVSRQGAHLRAEGLKAGVPDLFLPAARSGWHGLFIEMKRPGNKPSDAQNDWLQALTALGYACAVCYSDSEALGTLIAYLNGKLRL